MTNNNDKYSGINRNLWRRVYPSVRREPVNTPLVSKDTGLSYSLDLQKVQRHRDYYKIFTLQSGSERGSSAIFGQYDEGLIYFDNTTTETFTYNITFTGSPIIVFTAESASLAGTENINTFGGWAGLSSGAVETSAIFSGTIRYRAAYHTSYPVAATSIYTSSFTMFAGTSTPSNETSYTASYTALAAVPEKFLQSSFDSLSLRDADVFLSTSLTTATEANVEISTPTSSPINFIAFTNIVP